MANNYKFDKIDYLIMSTLQQNSNLTTKELAQQVNLSTTPVFERVRRLEKEGVIKKYIAVLDMDKINYGFVVFCSIKLRQINSHVVEVFTNAVKKLPHVTECYNVSGEYDYLLKIHASDMKDYQQFVLNELGKLDCIANINSTFVLDTAKEEVGYQLPADIEKR